MHAHSNASSRYSLLILRAEELLARIAYYRAALRFPFPFHEQLQNADLNIECVGNRITHVLIEIEREDVAISCTFCFPLDSRETVDWQASKDSQDDLHETKECEETRAYAAKRNFTCFSGLRHTLSLSLSLSLSLLHLNTHTFAHANTHTHTLFITR